MAEQNLIPRPGGDASAAPSLDRPGLKLFLVDDEAPARNRLRELLGDISGELATRVVGEAANGQEALMMIAASAPDIALVDVQMPEMNGLELTRHIARLERVPAVIFITAHDDYAVAAFDLSAADYLLKPVRAERLKSALEKAAARRPQKGELLQQVASGPRQHLSVAERGRVSFVPVLDILYMKAELKYVTVRTREREYLVEESLTQLEQEFAGVFVRVHRSCIVARRLIRGFERVAEENEGAGWAVLLHGTEERLPVSRRQWPLVKQLASP
jgi:two-component system response regulator AlgR